MSLPIETIALFLLLARLGSAFFITKVLINQAKLLNAPIEDRLYPIRGSLKRFRLILFILSLAILAGNLVPITIDLVTLFFETSRPAILKPLSIAYATSNALTSLVSAYLIYTLYRISKSEREFVDSIVAGKPINLK